MLYGSKFPGVSSGFLPVHYLVNGGTTCDEDFTKPEGLVQAFDMKELNDLASFCSMSVSMLDMDSII